MNSRIWTLMGALMVTFALSACGGGGSSGSGSSGDNSGSSGGGGGTDTLDLVEGDLKYENETENFKSYQNPDDDSDVSKNACEFSDYYLESENFMVYVNAGQTYSTDDLRTAATKAQLAMDAILPQFGMSWSDFYAMKRVVSFNDIDQFAREVSQLTDQNGPVTPDQISGYFEGIPDGSSQLEEQAFVFNALVEEENPQTVLNVINSTRQAYNELVGASPDEDSVISAVTPIHEKIQICATDNDRIARSSTSGIKISPDFADKEYRHESTHLIINQVSKVTAFWAKEGQTHLFLGEDVPASLTDVAVVRDNITGTDETDPGLVNIDKFKKAYLELVAIEGIDAQKVLDWHRRSMNIKAAWLTDEGGTGETISDAEREPWIMEAFGEVMPKSYDAFFDGL